MAVEYDWNPEDAIPESIRSMLSTPNITRANYVIIFLEIISLLKKQKRTGWLDFNIKECESISDHMYRMSIISTLLPDQVVNILSPERETVVLNRSRCVQIAVVHDMAESLVGDITPKDVKVGKDEKHYREISTMEYLTKKLIKPYNEAAALEIMELWLEYENISTIEARYVKDIDKFEMILQAFEYEKEHLSVNLEPFYESIASIKTTEIQELANSVLQNREVFLTNKK
ncbi:5'-deoxynucleotidase [Saccharomycopsis crataegensis]|uniref:5'-deoxynucleotidase n=1 Tax=Saccharomycopsis crataegensis TaxID=43959 RepID=A0AAV5QRQ9_9ASCO|nr:5'-deoxynucleotidase [Saccharomycopsis crataegensis]